MQLTDQTKIEELIKAFKSKGYNDIDAKNKANGPYGQEFYDEYCGSKLPYTARITSRSQNDPAWSGNILGLGNSGLKIGPFGCFCTSLAMLDGKTPSEMNIILSSGGGISKKTGLLYAQDAAKTLGYTYKKEDYSHSLAPLEGIIDRLKQGKTTILEVDPDHTLVTSPKHFVTAKKWDGQRLFIIDSWDGKEVDITTRYWMKTTAKGKATVYDKPGNCIVSIRYFDRASK
jgi:hypothetical protein